MQQLAVSSAPLFSTLGREAVERITRNMRVIDARRRTVIFQSGDEPSGIYIVGSGVIKLSLPTSRGDGGKVVALLGPGETFGASSMLADEPHIVSAVAARDSTVAHLSRASVLREMKREPRLVSQMALALNRRLRNVLGDVHLTATQSGLQRVVTFLLREVSEGNGNRRLAITLPVKKQEIASRLGLTPAHFSRILHELDSAGLIALERSTIAIGDVKRLRRHAAPLNRRKGRAEPRK